MVVIFKKRKYKKFSMIIVNNSNIIFKGFLGEISYKNFSFLSLLENSLKSCKVTFYVQNVRVLKKFLYKMFIGLSFGWFFSLIFNGRGFFVEGSSLFFKLNLGFSHGIGFLQSKNCFVINNDLFKNKIIIFGCDFAFIHSLGFSIKMLRPLDCYKGKGVKFENEVYKLKVGKRG